MSDIAEQAVEIVEEAIDDVVEVVEVVRNNPVALAAAGLVGVGIGAAGGYLVAKKQLRSFYEDLATEEIAQAKSFFTQVYKTDEDGTTMSPLDVLIQRHGEEAAAEALQIYSGVKQVENPVETEEELAQDEALLTKTEQFIKDKVIETVEETYVEQVGGTVNVFEDPSFDLAEEITHRSEDLPYIITMDEFDAGEKDYEQVALTYFKMDDTLVGEDDKPLEHPNEDVNEDHLVMFGRGSNDRNKVYIRNDRQGIDYEVIKSSGSYLEEVLGMPEENNRTLKHSDERDRRRALNRGDE